jgi:hypothetical protein
MKQKYNCSSELRSTIQNDVVEFKRIAAGSGQARNHSSDEAATSGSLQKKDILLLNIGTL